ncbi:MAG: hypothetical protein A2636_04570 [Elusimicrobia bacterium RIFCSPHIGHO2_01_FULL_64_10]|nr:MAG: hypothetical protein A2636_04570 [Elusimicrobia bacterium RIFCSPHIGHO2_01_FULL_64_10]
MTRGARAPWGYWTGGAFCLLGLLALSVGLVPLAASFFNRPAAFEVPGQTSLDLRLPGTYVAVHNPAGVEPADLKKLSSISYYLSDAEEKEYFKVAKFPPRSYYSDSAGTQEPIFEFIVDKKGRYILSADYPIGVEGPKAAVVLFHADASYVRTELVVGLIVFLLFAGLGGAFIWKSYRLEHPVQKKAPFSRKTPLP